MRAVMLHFILNHCFCFFGDTDQYVCVQLCNKSAQERTGIKVFTKHRFDVCDRLYQGKILKKR